MKKKNILTIGDVAAVTYHFEESLNQAILTIGSVFNLMSHKAKKTLHTGYWRNYVFIIFFTIILLMLINFWTF